jgi:SulP family sulfate permease
MKTRGSKLILSEINNEQVMAELQNARLLFQIGKGNVKNTFEQALKRANDLLPKNPHLSADKNNG